MNDNKIERDWLNVSEVAALLEVSRETVYSLLDKKVLSYSEIPGVRGKRILKADVGALIQASKSEEKQKKKKGR